MVDDWMETLLAGELLVSVPSLALVHGDGVRFQGSGRLQWDPSSTIRVLAETDGGAELFQKFAHAGAPLGKLLPPGEYVSVEGETQDGWQVSTLRVPRQGYRISDRSPHVVWNFETTGLSLRRPAEAQGMRRMIRALMGPPPTRWVRSTTTGIQNDYFGGSSFKRDWLLAPTVFGPVAARQRSEQWFEVRLSETQEIRSDARDVIFAVLDALSFVLGRRLRLLGYEDVRPNEEERHLFAAPDVPPGRALLAPLGGDSTYLDNVEACLGRAVDFFSTDLGGKVAQDLMLCWDTAANTVRTQHALVGVCLESLLRLAPMGPRELDTEPAEDDRRRLLTWLDSNSEALGQRFVTRLRGWATSVDSRTPVDILHDLRERGLVPVEEDDIRAWKQIRNPTLHGGRDALAMDNDQVQANLDNLFRVLNLVNRVVLHLIGYRGAYKNYGSPGWPEAQFPGGAPRSTVQS
jgi:hypothetical protein